jgi:hypothetical protein
MGEMRSTCDILMGKPEGKRPLGKPRRRYRILLKWLFKK